MSAQLKREEVVKRINNIFGEKYDTSKMEYKGVHKPVTITCKEHGDFQQYPTVLFQGRGCPMCTREGMLEKVEMDKDEFIMKAKEKHGDKYDYSKAEYINSYRKVTIVCPIHGEFKVSPINHINGAGCPKCSLEDFNNKRHVSNEEYIERAIAKHGDKYDYSLTHYVSHKIPVKIICPKHGIFEQLPYVHLAGSGCPECRKENMGKGRRLSFEDFSLRVRKVWGERYDLSKVEYVNNVTPVTVICPDHGEFNIEPTDLFDGRGCPKCKKGRQRLKIETLEDFIMRGKELYGEKYGYDKTMYKSFSKKVIVTCPIHGDFEIFPKKFLHGVDCPECRKESFGIKDMTRESFIEEAKKIHGEKFDYSKVEFKNKYTPVIIICPEHGEFTQKPYAHLNGSGCKRCSIGASRKKGRMSQEEFISKASAIHNSKYDYSKAVYEGTDKKVCIICPEHGEFWQTPHHHLHGVGCPYCVNNKSEEKLYRRIRETFPDAMWQQKFDFLKTNGKSLSIDIYIPSLNVAIECQGRQHFEPVEKYGGLVEHLKVKNRDERKYVLLKENNVKLFYFSYAKEIPDNYFDTIYTNESQLIEAISDYGNRL